MAQTAHFTDPLPYRSSPPPSAPSYSGGQDSPDAFGNNSVTQLLGKLADADSGVRREATRALGQLATKADSAVIAGLLERVVDQSKLVRKDAVEALVQVSDRGDETVVSSLLQLLMHNTWFVREAAAGALGRLAHKGDVRATTSLLAVLGDSREEVVQAALRALGLVARRGDGAIVDVLLRQLEEEGSWLTKRETAHSLSQVAEQGDGRVVAALLGRLSDPHEEIRRAAISALPDVAILGDQHLVETLATRLECTESLPDARAAAASLLGRVANDGSQTSRTGGVQNTAVRIAITSLIVCVRSRDDNWLVRRASIESLACLAYRGDLEVVDVLLPCVADGDTGVRQAAITALAVVAPRGHQGVVAALLEPLIGSESKEPEQLPFLRRAVIETLGSTSSVGDKQVIQAFIARLNDPSDTVREAAAANLQRISQQGDESVVEALLQELLSDEETG